MTSIVDPSFIQYLSEAPSDEELVTALEWTHPLFVLPLRWVRRSTTTQLRIETGASLDFEPADFTIEPAGVDGELEGSWKVECTDPQGYLYESIRNISKADRDIGIFCVIRHYLASDFTRLLLNPPVRLRVFRIDVDLGKTVVELTNWLLPRRRSGLYYDDVAYPSILDNIDDRPD